MRHTVMRRAGVGTRVVTVSAGAGAPPRVHAWAAPRLTSTMLHTHDHTRVGRYAWCASSTFAAPEWTTAAAPRGFDKSTRWYATGKHPKETLSVAQQAAKVDESATPDAPDHTLEMSLTAAEGKGKAGDASGTSKQSSSDEGEIKNAQIVFDTVWRTLVESRGVENMIFPKEIIWLMGAPGSGKGTNTPFITQARGLVAAPLVLSDILDSPEFKLIKDSGGMISDTTVVAALLDNLLLEQYRIGALVDGFPRTSIQVEIVTLLYNRMLAMKRQRPDLYPRPVFRMAVLYVDEKLSIERQLARGRSAIAHNEEVRSTGIGNLLPVRPTDTSEKAAAKRYSIFKSHFDTLTSLQQSFPFHLVNATGTIEDVRQRILKQFEYQSSLELEEATFDLVNKIPLANAISVYARQNLVKRLDDYQNYKKELFSQVIDAINAEFLPDIQQHAISGAVLVRTENELFEDRTAVLMALDILSERGYIVSFDHKLERVPQRVDLKTGELIASIAKKFYFYIKFPHAQLRTSHDGQHRDDITGHA